MSVLNRSCREQRGLTLIELVVFIVVVSVGLVGIMSALNIAVKSSADPVVQKQALAIAESILEEVTRAPFTWCDPTDANAQTATQFSDCATAALQETTVPVIPSPGVIGLATRPYDNVREYNGFSLPAPPGIKDHSGVVVTGLGGYAATVQVAADTLGPAGRQIAAAGGAALRVTVTVTGPGGVSVRLDGYRVRYAPMVVS